MYTFLFAIKVSRQRKYLSYAYIWSHFEPVNLAILENQTDIGIETLRPPKGMIGLY